MYFSLFFALLALVSRGSFELFFPKSLSYFLSLSIFCFFITAFFLRRKTELSVSFVLSLLGLFFLILSLLSFLVSGMDIRYSIYLVYPLTIVLFIYLFYSLRVTTIDRRKLLNTVTFLIYVLFIAALLEQLHLIVFPGATLTLGSIVRPPSLTGSYLHYPLVMVLFGVIVHSLSGKLTQASIIAYSSVFIAFSRSGMMLVILIFTLMFLHYFFLGKVKIKAKSLTLGIVFIFMIFLLASFYGVIDLIIDRLFSSIDLQGAGNAGRLEAWAHGLKMFLNSNLFLGGYFGKSTNLTANLSGAQVIVVESGLLQSLLNFGLLGTVGFYLFFVYMFYKSVFPVQKYFLIAFFFQSFVYQSIEVLPFIVGLFLLYPLTIEALGRES